MEKNRLSLNDVEWREFNISDLFVIKDGYYNKKPPRIYVNEKLPFLGATAFNNGITEFYSEDIIDAWDKVGNKNSIDASRRFFEGNCITIVNNGSVGNVYYQPHRFTCSHDMTPLYLKNKILNKELAMFLIQCLERTGKTYTYARKWRPKRIRKSKVFLPIDEFEEPHWLFMESYIKQEQIEIAHKVIKYYEQKITETGFDLMGLEDVKWKAFRIEEIFRVESVKGKPASNYEIGNIPYVTTSSQNNGVNNFVKYENNLSNRKAISVDPIAGKAFYHDYDFIGRGGAGSAINLLYNSNLDKYNGQFICTALERVSTEKASYGLQLNGGRLKNTKLILPVDQNGNPHWEYMSQFMQKIEAEKLEKALEYIYIYELAISKALEMPTFKEKEWKEFWIEDIVSISSGVRLTKADQVMGIRPFIGSTDSNNGITNFVNNTNSSLDSNVLGVNYNGSVVENFYHPYEAIFSDDVKRVHWIDKGQGDKYTYLFLKQAILQQKRKYAYGYKFNVSRMKRQKIMLPIKEDGTPDYHYMKQYIQIEEIKQNYKIIDYFRKI